MGASLIPYEQNLKRLQERYGSLERMAVLEIGSDRRRNHINVLKGHCRSVIGINIEGVDERLGDNAEFVNCNACDMSRFEDGTFDLVTSVAVFEHIGGLPQALAEMRRVLKPGGELVTNFGPIWSCMWGHHLWLKVGGQLITYSAPPVLPPYCHLLMSQPELEIEARRIYGAQAAPAVADFLANSPSQNRVFLRDYEEMFRAAGFSSLIIKHSPNRRLTELYQPGVTPQILAALAARYGDMDYSVAGLSVVATK
jgi:SAM-dependent methyltransferase